MKGSDDFLLHILWTSRMPTLEKIYVFVDEQGNKQLLLCNVSGFVEQTFERMCC